MKLYCKKCGNEMSLYDFCNKRDCDNERIGRYCRSCGEEKYQNLLKERLFEEYNGYPIYKKDDTYYPYWGSLYGFYSIDDCRKRLDNPRISVVNPSLLPLFSQD